MIKPLLPFLVVLFNCEAYAQSCLNQLNTFQTWVSHGEPYSVAVCRGSDPLQFFEEVKRRIAPGHGSGSEQQSKVLGRAGADAGQSGPLHQLSIHTERDAQRSILPCRSNHDSPVESRHSQWRNTQLRSQFAALSVLAVTLKRNTKAGTLKRGQSARFTSFKTSETG